MPISERLVVIGMLLVALAGCAATTTVQTMADLDVLATNDDFALVRLRKGQDFDDLARLFLGHPGERWQLLEVNANRGATPGQVVAVPLRPVNPNSVYSDGYRVLPILCYHQFTDASTASQSLELTAQAFEQQINYLVVNGYRLLSFADVDAILRQGGPIPEKAVVITIDDGYRSVYDVAWPILKKYQAKATLFIYTDFIGGSSALNWEQMREMADSGLIEIESHGRSHTSLSRLPTDKSKRAYQDRVRDEIAVSNALFQRHLGAPPTYISYPYGNSSTTASQIVAEQGLVLAATVTRGDNTVFSDPYLLHRTMIYDNQDMEEFVTLVKGFRKKNLK